MPNLTQSTRNPQKISILVIEDDADEQIIIRRAIGEAFQQVDVMLADGPVKALDYLNHCITTSLRVPHLILLDLYLPDREDGWRLLAEIRALAPRLRRLPIVVLSRSDSPEDIRTSYDRGVNAYMVKPESFERWVQYLQTLKDYWLNTATLPDQRFFP
ncbi:response regulator [Larkinella terrae]|uniref:Response regulator n=1 Tax=Larkinella terrae TaxID=2025311 RepID=A0A7K0EIH6_9BACT|nr:response regulator [Larkinella terrae]MRS61650.1 response regulator [Larkinella terrae]